LRTFLRERKSENVSSVPRFPPRFPRVSRVSRVSHAKPGRLRACGAQRDDGARVRGVPSNSQLAVLSVCQIPFKFGLPSAVRGAL